MRPSICNDRHVVSGQEETKVAYYMEISARYCKIGLHVLAELNNVMWLGHVEWMEEHTCCYA